MMLKFQTQLLSNYQKQPLEQKGTSNNNLLHHQVQACHKKAFPNPSILPNLEVNQEMEIVLSPQQITFQQNKLTQQIASKWLGRILSYSEINKVYDRILFKEYLSRTFIFSKLENKLFMCECGHYLVDHEKDGCEDRFCFCNKFNGRFRFEFDKVLDINDSKFWKGVEERIKKL